MADEADYASEVEQAHTERAIRQVLSVPMTTGQPGDCEYCGEHFARVVRGACGRCRDRHRLP